MKDSIRIILLGITFCIPFILLGLYFCEGGIDLHEVAHLGIFGSVCWVIDQVFLNA